MMTIPGCDAGPVPVADSAEAASAYVWFLGLTKLMSNDLNTLWLPFGSSGNVTTVLSWSVSSAATGDSSHGASRMPRQIVNIKFFDIDFSSLLDTQKLHCRDGLRRVDPLWWQTQHSGLVVLLHHHLPLLHRTQRAALAGLLLQFEDILETAIESVGPQLGTAASVDKLRGNAHAIHSRANAALKQVADAELMTNLFYVYGASLECEARIAGDDEQPAYACECRRDVLHDTVGKVAARGRN